MPHRRRIEDGNFHIELLEHTSTPSGKKAYTWKGCVERFIWAEFMTHRWARNASSSRAIPYDRMKAWIKKDPARHLHLGRNQSGMQSGSTVDNAWEADAFIKTTMLDFAVTSCDMLYKDFDLHKEILNRYTEPWGWINFVATMGEDQLHNAFSLRCTKYAHPNIQRLFVNMARIARIATPRKLSVGEWHMPYVTDTQRKEYETGHMTIQDLLIWSVARSAWTSYETVEGKKATFENAKKRHDDCVILKHATPCEHQLELPAGGVTRGCVPGYASYRMSIPGESTSSFDYTILDKEYRNCDFIIAE